MKLATLTTVVALAAAAEAAPFQGLNDEDGSFSARSLSLGLDLDLDLELGLGGGKCDFFTSTYVVVATPNQVVDSANNKTGGLKGAKGIYKFGINSKEDEICYSITLFNFKGEYQSLALTATHLHEAPKGMAGPPRIAFPNPKGGKIRTSKGCLKGPFKTGILANGIDTGIGFKVKEIEQNPKGFFADVHSSLAVPGAVRGQLH